MSARLAAGAAPALGAAGALGWLAPCLRAADYTPAALRRLLGIGVPDDVGPLNRAPALERVARDRSAAAALVRLFFLEAEEPERRVAGVLSAAQRAALVAAGVLWRRRGALRARVRVDPIGEQYCAADRRFHAVDRGALRLGGGDPVYPPSSDSLLVRDAADAADGRQVLDLCSGSGVQALQRAARAVRVVAVDVNPRAAAMTRFNAALNGLDNVAVRVGDLYAPVRGERFDLIVANPPFVSSPYDEGPSYHAGGPRGDRVLRRIIAGWDSHLCAGGRAFAVSHLALRAGENVADVARGWFRDFTGRALVLVLEGGTAVDLAAAQALFALDAGLAAYAREVRRWVAYLQRQRVVEVRLILITAERGRRRGLEVVDAPARVLPIPLSPPPAARIRQWLGALAAPGS